MNKTRVDFEELDASMRQLAHGHIHSEIFIRNKPECENSEGISVFFRTLRDS